MLLHEATAQIAASVSRRPDSHVLMLGAGTSAPAIPLASGVIEACRDMVTRSGRLPRLADHGEDPYEVALTEALPTAVARRDYFVSLIGDAPLTLANVLAACVLADGRIASRVWTTNFDTQVQTCLRLLGVPHVVCDHPEMVARITQPPPGHAIVLRLHGSYLYYDLKNTRAEVGDGADTDTAVPGLADYVAEQLRHRSPIVVGYSGWEHDVFMLALRRMLAAPRLAAPVYWCCYNRTAAARLPTWLTAHSDVHLVHMDWDQVAERAADAFTLDAAFAFDALLTAIRAAPPELTRAPLAALRRQWRFQQPESPAGPLRDRWGFADVDTRLDGIAATGSLAPVEVVEPIRDAGRTGDTAGAVRLARLLYGSDNPGAPAINRALAGVLGWDIASSAASEGRHLLLQHSREELSEHPSESIADIVAATGAVLAHAELAAHRALPVWAPNLLDELSGFPSALLTFSIPCVAEPILTEDPDTLPRAVLAFERAVSHLRTPQEHQRTTLVAACQCLLSAEMTFGGSEGAADRLANAFDPREGRALELLEEAVLGLKETQPAPRMIGDATWLLASADVRYPLRCAEGDPDWLLERLLDAAAVTVRSSMEVGRPTKASLVGIAIVAAPPMWRPSMLKTTERVVRSIAGVLPTGARDVLESHLNERLSTLSK